MASRKYLHWILGTKLITTQKKGKDVWYTVKKINLCKNGVPEEKKWENGTEIRVEERRTEKDIKTQIQETLPCGWEKFITNDIISKLLKTK